MRKLGVRLTNTEVRQLMNCGRFQARNLMNKCIAEGGDASFKGEKKLFVNTIKFLSMINLTLEEANQIYANIQS